MADVINLNRARKKKRAAEKVKAAETNRAKFGRTKAEKSGEKSDRMKEERSLDGHRLDEDA